MGLSVEFTVGDSTGRGFSLDEHRKLKRDPAYSLETIGKVVHTIVVNDELSLVGYIGLDLAYEAKMGPAKEMLARWDWFRGVRRSAASWLRDKDRALKRIDGIIAGVIQPGDAFDEPELGLDIMFGYGVEGRLSSLWRPDPAAVHVDGLALDFKYRHSEKRLTMAVSGTLSIADVDGLVKVGASRQFHFGKAPDTTALKRENLELLVALKERTLEVPGAMPDCGGNADRDHAVCKAWRAWHESEKKLADARDPAKFRARLSAGHLSLGTLMDLLKGIGQ